jgi:hypothetical protein
VETFVQTFSDLIRERLGELHLNAFSAENAAGLPPDAIRNVLRSEKQSGPTLARTKEICDALGLEIRIEPRGATQTSANQISLANVDPENDAPGGFLTIPWADAGPGRGSAPMAFSRAWLELHNLIPDFLQAAMPDVVALADPGAEDTLALIDTRSALRKGHGLWCYRDAGRVQVSHLTFKGSVTIVHPVRPEDEPRIIEGPPGAGIAILGKVVWLGQSIPFRGSVK